MTSPHVCVCHRVTEDEIIGLIRRGITTADGIGEQCGAGQGCGDCREMLDELIEDFAEDLADGLPEDVTHGLAEDLRPDPAEDSAREAGLAIATTDGHGSHEHARAVTGARH
ncbi:(2Fe-2S)-binding protein [Streptomyces sp. C]|uniref:(2Fe-2S)-binding protein n=1 Tax=Streptomyces sp. C TaxID=253839 RepID=UPI0001B57698|nr:(2Fe-2S)-binding protein [Streptomyces sp. C]